MYKRIHHGYVVYGIFFKLTQQLTLFNLNLRWIGLLNEADSNLIKFPMLDFNLFIAAERFIDWLKLEILTNHMLCCLKDTEAR